MVVLYEMGSHDAPSSTLLGNIASSLGASEDALRLLTSLLAGYPLGLLHRYTLYGKKPLYQHLFFALSGLAIGYFNYSWDVLHSLLAVLGTYAVLYFAGGTLLSVLLVVGYTMSYLLIGYYLTSAPGVDTIRWSMAQCVLTLRLIGIAFDVHDGTKPKEKQSVSTRLTAIGFTPTLLEILAHTYFPGGFLVGPQFSIKRYLEFASGMYEIGNINRGINLPDSLRPGFRRGALGIFYLGVYQLGISYFPNAYLLSAEYNAEPFYMRCVYLGAWGKIIMYKYIACWLLAEGVCILTGLAYNGIDESKHVKWDGCANVNLKLYEGGTKFDHIIQSFNMNTNQWAAQYIYKRMAFLGSRQISQVATLSFLALWHGIHSGYYMCFFMEFIVVLMENDLQNLIAKNQTISNIIKKPQLQPIKFIILKVITLVVMGYALAPFVLLSYDRWIRVYQSVHFFGHVVFLPWFLLSPIVKYLFNHKRRLTENSGSDKPTISTSKTSSRSSLHPMTKITELTTDQRSCTEKVKKYY